MPSFLLLPSPVVGALTWRPAAAALERLGHYAAVPVLDVASAAPPYWPHLARRAASAARDLPADEPLMVVAHSAAGLLVPAARAAMPERAIGAYLLADASLPRDGTTLVEQIPAAAGVTAETLRATAADGLLPPWGAGWPDERWASLIPDAELRRRFLAGLRPVPLALYEERTPAVPGWPDAPCAYLRFSAPYTDAEERARRVGWATRTLAGEHLHPLVDPDAVVRALLELATWAAVSAPPRGPA